MEELYLIMRDFLEVEHHQESMLCLLRAAEAGRGGEGSEDVKLIVSSMAFYLQALKKELRMAINRLDSYIVGVAKR